MATTKKDPKPTGIAAVAAQGDRLATLEAMRDRLAADMDVAPPTVSAQLAAQLSKVLAEIAELSKSKKVSSIDELAKRRSDRFAASDIPEPAQRQTRERGTRSS
jgi:hypothetical protein